jgi:type I restriction-modification system DNA methylase subunit
MSKNDNKSSSLAFKATLWATADKLRRNLAASEYKLVVLGLIFLKYISDAFAEEHAMLKADFILANPPFNMSDWGDENLRQDVRWKFGRPLVNNAKYA